MRLARPYQYVQRISGLVVSCSSGWHSRCRCWLWVATTPAILFPRRLVCSPHPQFAAGPYSISGVVADNGQPMTNAAVNAWVELGSLSSYSYTYAHGPLSHRCFRRVSHNKLAGRRAGLDQAQQGRVRPAVRVSAIISGDLTMDLALVSIADLTASAMPSAPGLRSVSGTVVEMTATGSQPVAGAFVTAETGVDSSIAPSENAAAYT